MNNIAIFKGEEKLEGRFVSSNVFHLSRKSILEAEILLLPKGLKLVPTSNKIDKAKLKR